MKKIARIQSFALLILAAVLLAVIAVLGSFWQEAAIRTDFTRKNLAPCIQYPFGADWMGRDMFVRTVAGLSLSIRIGLLTAAVSAVMAFILGLSAAVFESSWTVRGAAAYRYRHGNSPYAASDPDSFGVRC
ncbi:MAG: hypothetical protein ACLR78_04610 [Roseburia sp.]